MWPWGHLAVGYLCYVIVTRYSTRLDQTGPGVLAVALGTQFPDLVDKPLVFFFDLIPSGRSLAHSLITATFVIAVVYYVASKRNHRDVAIAFAIGYVSHSLADLGPDFVIALLQGDWSQLQWATYLLWPVLPAPPYPSDSTLTHHVLVTFSLSPYMLAQFVLFGIAVVVWVKSGTPGLDAARNRLRT